MFLLCSVFIIKILFELLFYFFIFPLPFIDSIAFEPELPECVASSFGIEKNQKEFITHTHTQQKLDGDIYTHSINALIY